MTGFPEAMRLVPADQQPPGRLTDEQIAKLTLAQKLDYTRQFNQQEMPAWKDPRAGATK